MIKDFDIGTIHVKMTVEKTAVTEFGGEAVQALEAAIAQEKSDREAADVTLTAQVERAEAIARGRATGYVFDTYEDMTLWLADETHLADLNLGDNFYIRALNVPDYWWDGTKVQQLETQKVDLTECYTKTETKTLLDGKADKTVRKINSIDGNIWLSDRHEIYLVDGIGNIFISNQDVRQEDVGLQCYITFKTGDVPPTISETISMVYTGDDCDSTGYFNPQPNTRYEIDIKCVAYDYEMLAPIFVARVGAC